MCASRRVIFMTETWETIQKKRLDEMIAYTILFALVAADMALTLHALEIGFVEWNPVMAFLMDVSVPLAIAVKFVIIAIPAAIILVVFRGNGRKTVMTSAIVSACVMGVVVAWNAIQLMLVTVP